jgi:ElaB/YqjD/DUF883 family membrane-anchored ribosome-binding protein
METTETTQRSSFFGLIGHLRHEVVRLIRQEIQLAKTEMIEKVSKMARNAGFAAAGGIVALIGAELLFIGMGIAGGYGLIQLGLDPGLAYSAGIGGMGILIAIIGTALLMKGIKAFTAKSLAPQQTIDTMRELAGKPIVHKEEVKTKSHNGDHKESSDELRKRFEETRHQVQRTTAELRQRAHVGKAVAQHVSSHPMRTLAMGLASGYLGGRILKKRIAGSKTTGSEKLAKRIEKKIDKLEAHHHRGTLLGKLFSKV